MQSSVLLSSAVIAVSTAVLPCSAADAAPARTAWSTYLRDYPSQGAAVMDEIEHDSVVDIIGCRGGWCAVQFGRAAGYIDADALDGGMRLPGGGGVEMPTSGCFPAQVPGYAAPLTETYCPKQ